MKKIFSILMVALVMVSCNDRNTNQPGGNPDEPVTQVPAIVALNFHLDATNDMLQYLDYTVTYDDGTGEFEEIINSTRWEKTLTAALPATFTIKTRLRVKEGMYDALIAAQSVNFTRGHGYAYQVFDSTATAIPGMNDSFNSTSSSQGVGANIAEHCENGDFDKTYTISFDKDGNRIQN